MKVTIVGAAGKVGAAAAFALQMGGVIRELLLIDFMDQAALGEAIDLRHGTALCGPLQVSAGDYDAAAGSDIVVITAGVRRQPDESRLQLINRNVSLFRDIMARLGTTKLDASAILVVVANPVDILTHIAIDAGWPPAQTIGTGTFLDTTRFRSLLASHLECDARSVDAWILGEHGDSMVPVWSQATIGGAPLAAYPGFTAALGQEIFAAVRGGGAEMIRLKGGAAYAIGLCVRDVVHAIARDARMPLPLSTLQRGACGVQGVCLSLPTIVGRAGVCAILEPKLASEELAALKRSAAVLQDAWTSIA